MIIGNNKLVFIKLENRESLPYELLLSADPSKDLVDSYLSESAIFIAKCKDETVGIVVILLINDDTVEIKNIAVKTEFQGQGIGSFLINSVINQCKLIGFRNIQIGTANSSIGQLSLYQKLGFEIAEIRKNFFIDNYSDPIYENGIQAKHMILLNKEIINPE